jgi:sialate O-acetylesterase
MILHDFQIIQREPDGFARFVWEGIRNEPLESPEHHVAARVVREDDNLCIIPWTICNVTDNHIWSVSLAVPEGGLYRFEASIQQGNNLWIDKIKCVYHIGIGDIYVTAGQSNMTGYGRDSAYDPPCLGVHMFRNTGEWSIAAHPLADALDGVYDYPENGTGTSPALSFARRLHERLGVPIGLVPTAVGGTSLSQWDPTDEGGCYRSMEKRLAVTGEFKGFIWLQGCNDCNDEEAPTYFDRFSNMVSVWNKRLGVHPILTVQLNRAMQGNSSNNDRYWGMVRDAQRRAAVEIDNVYVVPSIDLPTTDGIHNSSGANVIIGERLANVALSAIYGKPGQSSVLVLSAEVVDDTHIKINLTPGHSVLAMDNIALGMNVEDSDGLIDCIEAAPLKAALLVSTSRPYKLPAQFHYAWRAHPPVFFVRDFFDMPVLACYGVEINRANN